MHYLNQQSMDHLHSNGPGPSLNKKNANNRSEEHWRFSKDEGHKLGGNALVGYKICCIAAQIKVDFA